MDYKTVLQNITPLLCSAHPPEDWVSKDDIVNALEHVKQGVNEDLAYCQKNLNFLYDIEENHANILKDQFPSLMKIWIKDQSIRPSLTSIICQSIEKFGLDIEANSTQKLLIAALLGDVPHLNPYHDNMHFRMVVMSCIALISANHYLGNDIVLDKEEIALLLSAACAHDLGHDGVGNTINGHYMQSRLENRSVDLLCVYLGYADFDMSLWSQKLRAMILATDVNPIGDLNSPLIQLRMLYQKKHEDLNLIPYLSSLKDQRACLLALLLQEADIASSAGYNVELSRYLNCLVAEEVGGDAVPENLKFFLEKICGGEMLSEEAKFLFDQNYKEILDSVSQDIDNHVIAYEVKDFIPEEATIVELQSLRRSSDA